MELTTSLIESARYDGKSYVSKGGRKSWSKHVISDDAVEGLGLRVFPSGRKTFVLTYREQGKKRTMTLGEFGSLTLEEARKKGTDLLEFASTSSRLGVSEAGRRLSTLADLAQAYFDDQVAGRGSVAFAQQRLIRLRINPVLGKTPLTGLDSEDIWRLRAQLTKRYPADAGRLSGLLRLIFKWASEHGHWEGQSPRVVPEDGDKKRASAAPDLERPEETPVEEATERLAGAEPQVAEELESEEPSVEPDAASGDELVFESTEELEQAYRELKLEFTRARHELEGVKRYAGTEEQKLVEKIEDAERRAGKLSASVQQLQDVLRETEEELERSKQELGEAGEQEQTLRWEISALNEAAKLRDSELRRLKAKLESSPPPVPRPVAAVKPPPSRPRALFLGGSLAVGTVLGALLVFLLGPGQAASTTSSEPSASVVGAVSTAGAGETVREVPSDFVASVTIQMPPGEEESGQPAESADESSEPVVEAGDRTRESRQESLAASTPESEAGTPTPARENVTRYNAAEAPEAQPDLAAADATVHAWAAAWSEQRVEDYLGFYSERFTPPGDLSREQWEVQRRSRILRPDWIRLSIGSVSASALEPNRVSATFDQAYTTDSFSDEVEKTLVLTWEAGAWKIVNESSK